MSEESSNNLAIKAYLLRSGTWAFVGKIASAVAGLMLMGLLARLLSPTEMGLYFLAFNLATFFSILGRLGMENTLMRFIAQARGAGQWGRLHSIYTKGTVLVLAGALAAGVLATATLPYIGIHLFELEPLAQVSWLVGGWATLLAIQFTMGEVLRGHQRIGASVLVSGLVTAVLSILFLGLIYFSFNLVGFTAVIAVTLAALIINNGLALYLQHRIFINRPNSAGETIRTSELLDHSWPLLINAITLYILGQSDVWLLGAFATPQDLAVYAAASRLVMLASVSLAIVNMVVPPIIAQMQNQNQKKGLQHLLRTAASLSGIPALTVMAIFMLFAPLIMELVYGEHYRSGSTVLIVLCAGQVINVMVGSCGYLLIMTGHRKTVMSISLSSALIAILLGVYLVRESGLVGLASAYTIAVIAQQLSMWLAARWQCGVWTHVGLIYCNPNSLKSLRMTG